MKKHKYFNINDLYMYNEYLSECGYEQYLDDAEFDEMFENAKPTEIMRMCFYGDFNYTDDFYRVDGYGNLASYTTLQVEDEMNEDMDWFSHWLQNTYNMEKIETINEAITDMLSDCKTVEDLETAFSCFHSIDEGNRCSPYQIKGIWLRTDSKPIETFSELKEKLNNGSKFEEIIGYELHFLNSELGLDLRYSISYCYRDIANMGIDIYDEGELIVKDCSLEDLGIEEVKDLEWWER